MMTRFAGMPQRIALTIVLVAFISALWLVVLAETAPITSSVVHKYTDPDTYLDILALMHSGVGYYEAAHEILLAHGYGLRSVFNWRTPAWMELLSLLPSIVWAQKLLAILTSATLLLAYRMIRAQGNIALAIPAIIGIFFSIVLLARDRGIVMSEVATGALILLSVVNYGNGQWLVGLLAALAALFIRELAAPYILICVAFAAYRANARELVGWALGLSAYFAYFSWHWIEVMQQIAPTDRADPNGWIRFGGIRFVLETAHFNGLFNLTPLWITAALLPAALLGLFAWRDGLRAAVTVTTYLCIFAVVGKPFNDYWGALYTPLLMLGLPWSIPAVYDALAPRRPSALPQLCDTPAQDNL